MTATPSTGSDFGTNSWLVEEMYEQYRDDPGSVTDAWREFFTDYRVNGPAPRATEPAVVRGEPPAP
ncbi:MAG: hypothetical protein H0U21_16810, partial [Acidimicrobiia bacterium]|nr:hypothetical protein [Acidimicrobiia bacterium]